MHVWHCPGNIWKTDFWLGTHQGNERITDDHAIVQPVRLVILAQIASQRGNNIS